MKRSWCVVAAMTALLCASAARAETEAEYQNPPPANPNPKPAPAARLPAFAPGAAASLRRLTPQEREERAFLKQAAGANRFHADAARLAMVKSSDPGLRSVALFALDERAIIGNELLRLLHQRGMAAPMLENAHRKTLNRLGRLQARKFDREYLGATGASQKEEVEAYEKAVLALEDPALRAWIAGKLPVLRYALASAERVASPQAASPAARGAARSVRPTATSRMGSAAAHPSVSNTR